MFALPAPTVSTAVFGVLFLHAALSIRKYTPTYVAHAAGAMTWQWIGRTMVCIN